MVSYMETLENTTKEKQLAAPEVSKQVISQILHMAEKHAGFRIMHHV